MYFYFSFLSFDFLKAKDVFSFFSKSKIKWEDEENWNFIFDSDENRSFLDFFSFFCFFPSRFLFSFCSGKRKIFYPLLPFDALVFPWTVLDSKKNSTTKMHAKETGVNKRWDKGLCWRRWRERDDDDDFNTVDDALWDWKLCNCSDETESEWECVGHVIQQRDEINMMLWNCFVISLAER